MAERNEPAGEVVVGVDVGGTFTDVVAIDDRSGDVRVGKVASTRSNEASGFLDGLQSTAGPLDQVAAIVHGTTVGTNALLERRGAVTAVIATEGFADVLEMRRRDRPRTWGLWGDFEPVSPRNLRVGVSERTLADGTRHTVVDVDQVTKAAEELLAGGAVAVAVTFLHSYANPANEQEAAAAVRALWPNDSVSVSSEILPEIREFERTSTTVLNAYLQPVVGGYLAKLEEQLASAGFVGEFLIVASNGGVMTVESARRFPVRTALSGPAAGVIAAAAIAKEAGVTDVITGDVGGTSFDVAVIAGGQAVLAAQTTIDFGLTIRSPMIEISTIGAGGGSIAWVDRSGLLQIGPESAGGVPGPACYQMGNDRPTVTDAAVALGRINPDRPIGGRSGLDVDAARTAIEIHVAVPLDITVDAAAAAILTVATSRMAGALRLVSVERGHDPSKFWLMPFGGGGGLNCCELVADVGLAGALVPRHPGVISALGCVIADMRHDMVRTVRHDLATLDEAGLRKALTRAEREGRDRLDSAGVAFDEVTVRHELDMSYAGQSHTVATPLLDGSGEPLGAERVDRTVVLECFERAYTTMYGRLLAGLAVSIATVRTAVSGVRPSVDLRSLGRPTSSGPVVMGSRPVYFDGAWTETEVIERAALAPGDVVVGPAILEQLDATTVLPPGWSATVDDLGNLRVARPGRSGPR